VAIAFFDLDRTVISVNSGQLWVKRELRLGHVTRWQAARAAAWIAGYHLGYSRIERVLEDAIATLQGVAEEVIAERTAAFYREEVAGTVRPGARRALAEHRDRGDRLVLLTSASTYLGAPMCAELGLDGALCNRFEVVAGRFTGRPLGTLCFGAGKLEHARTYAMEQGESIADAAFYTDSYSDRAVMEVVGRPVAVHPDQRLRRLAGKRGWEIADWGAPSPG
jgi:HAD superfamily hydrolase (TIGR01490 family)